MEVVKPQCSMLSSLHSVLQSGFSETVDCFPHGKGFLEP